MNSDYTTIAARLSRWVRGWIIWTLNRVSTEPWTAKLAVRALQGVRVKDAYPEWVRERDCQHKWAAWISGQNGVEWRCRNCGILAPEQVAEYLTRAEITWAEARKRQEQR